MTKQEIFNKAYLGLKSQGFKRSGTVDQPCMYNGPNNTHCAIGWVIPNLPESHSIKKIAINFPEKLLGIVAVNNFELLQILPFLRRLQTAHDEGFTPTEMQRDMLHIAKDFNLEVPE